MDDSLQISTIIHELAHFLLFDITVNILCKILDVNPSSVIKSFVEHFLTLPEIEVINEFYAHSVENRFIPLKYQNFNSFIKCASDLNMGGDDLEFAVKLGNSFAYEVIHYLQKYIDEGLRESIRLQYKIDMIETKKLENDFGDIVFNPQEKNLLFLSLIIINCLFSIYIDEMGLFPIQILFVSIVILIKLQNMVIMFEI